MKKRLYIETLLRIVVYAYNNNLQNVNADIWNCESKQILKIKNMSYFEEIKVDKEFYDKANILLNNFEHEINNVPSEILNENTIISDGIVFTPIYLAKIIVKLCLKYISNDRIILAGDISSGMGAFIYALNTLIPEVNTLSFEKNEMLHKFSSIVFSNKKNTIMNIDTIKADASLNGKFNLIVGNPPYVRLQNIDDDTRKRIECNDIYKDYLFGSYDLSIAFIIKTVRLLNDKGVAGLVLTRKIFSAAYGERICKYLSQNVKILKIIDFGDNQIFHSKTTYTLVIFFQKTTELSLYDFSYCKIPIQNTINESNLMQLIESNEVIYDSSVLNDYPWNFFRKNDKDILSKMEKKGNNIFNIFSCVQGFRTGNNKAFFVENEGEFIRPYVDGECIGKGRIKKTKKIIWPYIRDEESYFIIKENELKKRNALAYEHLLATKKEKTGRPIHEYLRPQNLYAMDRKKIFVKEMMPCAEFAADKRGNLCFGSGYALIPKNDMTKMEIEGWSFILSTKIMEYQYRLISTNLHSGWFRMYKGHLSKINVPDIDFEDEKLLSILHTLTNNISEDAFWEKLDEYVAKKFGLSLEEKQYIFKYIKQFHKFSLSTNKTKGNEEKMDKEEYKDDIRKTAYPELTGEKRDLYYPVELTKYNKLHVTDNKYRALVTFQNDKKVPIQRWYKYTQGYSALLVSKLIDELGVKKTEVILDPFCGSGTTLLAAKNNGISSLGCDVSPLSCWISKVKTYKWTRENALNILNLLENLNIGYDYNYQKLQFIKFFEKAFYPEILAQTMYIKNWIDTVELAEMEKDFLRMALISIQEEISFIRKHGSHYRFLNDDSHIGVNKLNIELIKEECNIVNVFKDKANDMINDIMMKRADTEAESMIFCSDILKLSEEIKADVVITSPPYLNRNNYFSQQKIELSLLNLIDSAEEYTKLVKQSFCSHVEADLPEKPICRIKEVNTIIGAVTKRKSNNAKIPHMIAGYFNDIDKFFERLPKMLNKTAKIAIVVANCRWNGVVIPVDHLVCRIAEQYGFSADKIIVARMKGNSPQQMQKFGKIPVRESVVLLSYKFPCFP